MPRIMAIDFGRKRVGFAVTDETSLTIRPLEQVFFNQRESWNNIRKSIKKYSPQKIIIGWPGYPPGVSSPFNEKSGSVTKEIGEFKRHLEKLFPAVEIIFFDEEDSSKEAGVILRETKKSLKQKKARIDSIAAAIILRKYLEEHDPH